MYSVVYDPDNYVTKPPTAYTTLTVTTSSPPPQHHTFYKPPTAESPCTVLHLLRACNSGASSQSEYFATEYTLSPQPLDTTSPDTPLSSPPSSARIAAISPRDSDASSESAHLPRHTLISSMSGRRTPQPAPPTTHLPPASTTSPNSSSSATEQRTPLHLHNTHTNYAVLHMSDRGVSHPALLRRLTSKDSNNASNSHLYNNDSTNQLYKSARNDHSSASNLLLHGYNSGTNLYTRSTSGYGSVDTSTQPSPHGRNNASNFGSTDTFMRRIQSEQSVQSHTNDSDRKKRQRAKTKMLQAKMVAMQSEIGTLSAKLQQYEMESVHLDSNNPVRLTEPSHMKYLRRCLYTSNVLLGTLCGVLRFVDALTNKQLIDGVLSRAVVPRNTDVNNPPLAAVLITGALHGLQSFTPFLVSAALLMNPHAIRRNISLVLSVLYSINTAITNRRTAKLAMLNIILNLVYVGCRWYNTYVGMRAMEEYKKREQESNSTLLHRDANTETDTDNEQLA